MSMTMTLVPLVIALGSTVSTASLAALCTQKTGKLTDLKTTFTDNRLLLATLREHGLNPTKTGEEHIEVITPQGVLCYERSSSDEPYILNARNVHNMTELTRELKMFEEEYGRNVQSYTYNRILESLTEHGLVLQEEEVMEDDTIVLTLNV